MLNKLFTLIFTFSLGTAAVAQQPFSDFMFPIKPGKPNGLAGTVGELRTTHFHTGLDIKTDGVEGLPVYASQTGYISRISVSPNGYGHALYIKHPNGYTTVYGHLQRFNEEIADYVLSEQYRAKSFSINRYPGKAQFPVNQGDIIAYSGNSGSSGGPHLHWDVRDGNQRPVSSLKARFEEITDTVDPVIYNVAFVPMTENARVNGKFERKEYRVVKNGSDYTVREPVSLSGEVGMELLAYDKLNGYRNLCGIYSIELLQNEKTIYKSKIDRLSFTNQRSIFTYYNYPVQVEKGEKYHKLYIADGNDLKFYKDSPSKGIIRIHEGDKLKAILTDPYGNKSTLTVNNSNPLTTEKRSYDMPYQRISDNFLVFGMLKAMNEENMAARVYEKGEVKKINPYAESDLLSEFIVDLRKTLPDSIIFKGKTWKTDLKQRIPSGIDYRFYDRYADITISKNDLFDTLYLEFKHYLDSSHSFRETFIVGNENIPLNKSVQITLKPEFIYEGKGWSVYTTDKKNNVYYQGGSWNGDKITFNTRYFGDFILLQDTIPPEITPISVSSRKLEFKISDNLSGVDNYELYIDGQWILMHYDPKRNRIWSEFPKERQTISGNMLLRVTDNEGNEQKFKFKL